MTEREKADKEAEGIAALSICESMLIALSDLKIIDEHEVRAVLKDAAETHRNAIPGSANPDQHRAVALLIERIIDGKRWAPK